MLVVHNKIERNSNKGFMKQIFNNNNKIFSKNNHTHNNNFCGHILIITINNIK